ncbi:MAG TPA: hypothetical protein PL060_05705, partial [bacterium]|nr:hypothetical protein [bacterium]
QINRYKTNGVTFGQDKNCPKDKFIVRTAVIKTWKPICSRTVATLVQKTKIQDRERNHYNPSNLNPTGKLEKCGNGDIPAQASKIT